MAKKLFKGFKQVTFEAFNEATDKEGYIWFVRTPEGNAESGELDANVNNDSYDIYFGSVQYGHFGPEDAKDISALATALENIRKAVGLEKSDYGYVPFPEDLEAALDDDKTIKHAISYIFEQFKSYKGTNDGAIDSKIGFAKIVDNGHKITFYKKQFDEGQPGEELFTISSDEFVKDGMLNDVEVTTPAKLGKDITVDEGVYHFETEGEKDTQFLHFVWNVDTKENKESPVKEDFVLLSSIATTYKADGTSIEKSTDNVFSVKNVTFDKSHASEMIPVAGGPLAKVAGVTEKFPNGIPTNMPMQDILMNLFCKEEYPNIKYEPGSISGVLKNNPSITLVPSGTVEVGTIINVTVKGNDTNETHVTRQYNNMTNGYASDVNGSNATADKSKKAEESGNELCAYGKLSASGKIVGENNKSAEHPNAEDVTGTFVAEKGTNKVNASETPNQYHITYGTLPAVYAKSNIGNYSEDHMKAAQEDTVTRTSVQTAKNASASVTGAYKYYEGYASEVPSTSDGIKALNHSNGWCILNKDGEIALEDGGTVPIHQNHCIAVPNEIKLVSFLNGMDLESKDSYVESGVVKYDLPNGTQVDYHIYSQEVRANFVYKKITLK